MSYLVSLITDDYQHNCWVHEVCAMLGRTQPHGVWLRQMRQVAGDGVLQWA